MRQGIKHFLNLVFLAAAFPMAAATGFGRWLESFTFFAQFCALAPGLPGDYLRIAFYRLTLDECSLENRISQGSFFVNPRVRLATNVYIGAYCIIGPCQIGDRTLIASFAQIMPGRRQHPRRADGTLEPNAEVHPVSIGSDCWLGASAIVMEDVGQGSTVAAGAIVVNPVEPHTTVAGNPARVIVPKNKPLEGAAKS
jgi:acetyltransferase-like isoleucine patch superfamily enzyme